MSSRSSKNKTFFLFPPFQAYKKKKRSAGGPRNNGELDFKSIVVTHCNAHPSHTHTHKYFATGYQTGRDVKLGVTLSLYLTLHVSQLTNVLRDVNPGESLYLTLYVPLLSLVSPSSMRLYVTHLVHQVTLCLSVSLSLSLPV